MEKYLRPKLYYSDLYDKHTVETCRWWEERNPTLEDLKKKKEAENIEVPELLRTIHAFNNLHMYFLKGDRYIKKEETIREWMERDKKRDELFETAEAPTEITCLTCGRLMFVTHKHLETSLDGPDRVMFMYDCPLNHIPRRAFYNDGKEFRREPPVCSKCKGRVEENDKREKDKIVITRTCTQCGNVDTDEIDLTSKKVEEVVDPNFDRDRERFCMSEKEGQEFIQAKQNVEGLSKFMDGVKEKEKNKELYDEVAKLKKLKITELEELLTPILEKAGYIKLQFKNPEITKDVFLPFIVYDQKADREGRSSSYDLEKLLRKTLKDTNWRLVTGGVSYRLGMLEGRLHGYDREEDLLKLVQNDKK